MRSLLASLMVLLTTTPALAASGHFPSGPAPSVPSGTSKSAPMNSGQTPMRFGAPASQMTPPILPSAPAPESPPPQLNIPKPRPAERLETLGP